MPPPQLPVPLSAADYLAWEAAQDTRNEFIDGEVLARSESTAAHNMATGALASTLHQHLRGKPCRPFVSDMKVLQEYVLIDTETPQVEVFRRNAANRWELYPSTGPDAAVELASVGWQGTVADLLA